MLKTDHVLQLMSCYDVRELTREGSLLSLLSHTIVVNSSHPELDQLAAELAVRGLLRDYFGRYFPDGRAWERAMLKTRGTRNLFVAGPGRRSAPAGLEGATRFQPGVAYDFAAGLIPRGRFGRTGELLYRSVLMRRDRAIIRTAIKQWNGIDAVTANHSMASELFQRAHAATRPCILNFPLAHPAYVNRVLREEADLHPEFAADLMDQASAPRMFEQLHEEVELADSILVGSSFAKRSFVVQGVPEEKLFVSPYGVNVQQFSSMAGRVQDGMFRAVWAGQITQRKGIKYLLQAWRSIQGPDMELVLAGHFMATADSLMQYSSLFRYVGFLTANGLCDLFQTADVLVLPSLIEGMGLVVLQAMAAQVPVIVSENGPGDLVRDGVDGFIVPIRDPDAIADRLLYLRDNPEKRVEMGRRAQQRSMDFTWDHYRKHTADHVEALLA